jgi:hypothetical protein
MAVFADIVELRLRIKDPLGAIAILSVADVATRQALANPAPQTAYKQLDTGIYYTYDADLAEWEAKKLLISDTRIGVLIDLVGVAAAAPKAIKDIMAELGQRLYVARTQDGAGSTDYQNLSTMKNFYQELAASMEQEVAKDDGESQGRMLRIRRSHIAGGMHF